MIRSQHVQKKPLMQQDQVLSTPSLFSDGRRTKLCCCLSAAACPQASSALCISGADALRMQPLAVSPAHAAGQWCPWHPSLYVCMLHNSSQGCRPLSVPDIVHRVSHCCGAGQRMQEGCCALANQEYLICNCVSTFLACPFRRVKTFNIITSPQWGSIITS